MAYNIIVSSRALAEIEAAIHFPIILLKEFDTKILEQLALKNFHTLYTLLLINKKILYEF